MCCFSQPIEWVAGTKIFARLTEGGTQLLAYQMDFEAAGDLAMILPLPVRPGAGEDALRFVDLSGYPGLFDALAAGFPSLRSRSPDAPVSRMAPQAKTLVVHDVGSFEASYVPTIADFARLDERFRLPTGVWDELPGYADYGFAVFKLRDERSLLGRFFGRKPERKLHPMAFELPTRSSEVFFPTVHVHDGHVHETAEFDHALYMQRPGGRPSSAAGEWDESMTMAAGFVDVSKACGLVLGGEHCYRRTIVGSFENADVWA